MNHWIETNTLDLATRRGKKESPTRVNIMLSPYDVPNAVRSYHEGVDVIIEFRYINIVESHSIYSGDEDGVSFEIGDKTQRIYKIVMNSQKMSSCQVNISLENTTLSHAIDHFISHQESLNKKTAKYSATRSIINDYGTSLQEGI